MKKILLVIVALLFVVTASEAQLLTYSDSTGSITGFSTDGVMRADQAKTSFKTYWWGPYDVSDCWVVRNEPGVSTQVDTVVFRSYFTGIVNYAAGDTMLCRWEAYLSEFPYPPQTRDGATTTWSYAWNSSNADSLISWKVRAANDFVSTSRDGYPMHSRFQIATVATDTIAYTNLFITLELDSTTGTPAYTEPLDFDAYWSFHCVKK